MLKTWTREIKKKATKLSCGDYMPAVGRIDSYVIASDTVTIFYFAGGNENDRRKMVVPITQKIGVWTKVTRHA